MAKMMQVSKAEHEMLVAAYAQDSIKIAMLEAELKQAKEDIKRLLVLGGNSACEFCSCKPPMCNCCEKEAEWRGWKENDRWQ